MKYTALSEASVVFILLLTACSSSEIPATTPSSIHMEEPTSEATQSPATEVPAAVESPVATETAGIPLTGAAMVQIRNVGDLGSALVDSRGYSLYLFTGGNQYQRPSSCVGEECLEEWIPLVTSGEPVAGEGVDAALLGTIPRDDGTTQVTYNGWRLYYLNQDQAPGDAMGQGDDKEWYLVSPSGEPIKSLERE